MRIGTFASRFCPAGRRYLPVIAGSLSVAGFMLVVSWRKWVSILWDFGRELYIPWQLSEGKVLYQDIAHFRGPFSQYLNAFVFWIFGPSMMTLAVFNIALIVVIAVLIYNFFLMVSGRFVATVNVFLFLTMFAFSQLRLVGNFNYVCPYAHEITHSLLFSLASMCLFQLYLKKRRRIIWLMIGFFGGIVFLSKSEVFVALLLALMCGLAVVMLTVEKRGSRAKVMLFFAAGIFLPIGIFVAYFLGHMPLAKVISHIIFPYKQIIFGSKLRALSFYSQGFGTDHPAESAVRIILCGVAYLIVFAILWLVGLLAKSSRNRLLLKVFMVAMAVLGAAIAGYAVWVSGFDRHMFAATPLVLIVFICFMVCRVKGHMEGRKMEQNTMPFLVYAVFSLVLLAKMFFYTRISGYGFVLCLPAVTVLVMLLLSQLPLFFQKHFGGFRIVRMAGLTLVCTVIFGVLPLSLSSYKTRNFPVGKGRDKLFALDLNKSYTGLCFDLCLWEIERLIPPDTGFVVLPRGALLNFLTRRETPSRYLTYISSDIIMFGEREILSDLKTASPEFIVIVGPYDPEREISEWLRKTYVTVRIIGGSPLEMWGGISINRRIGDKENRADFITHKVNGKTDISKSKDCVIYKFDVSSQTYKFRVNLLNRIGIDYADSGDYDAALQVFKTATEIAPSYSESYCYMGYVYALLGENKKAEEFFKKTLEIAPGHRKAQANLGALKEAQR